MFLCVLETVPDDALYPFSSIYRSLDGYFIGRPLFEYAAGARIQSFRIFPEDDKVDIFDGFVF